MMDITTEIALALIRVSLNPRFTMDSSLVEPNRPAVLVSVILLAINLKNLSVFLLEHSKLTPARVFCLAVSIHKHSLLG